MIVWGRRALRVELKFEVFPTARGLSTLNLSRNGKMAMLGMAFPKSYFKVGRQNEKRPESRRMGLAIRIDGEAACSDVALGHF